MAHKERTKQPFFLFWIVIGIGIGALIGGLIKNFALGVGLGVGIGILLALWADRINKRRTDR
ncbi:hypothetical protein ACFLRY_05760 [Bacteroidota bacterium]